MRHFFTLRYCCISTCRHFILFLNIEGRNKITVHQVYSYYVVESWSTACTWPCRGNQIKLNSAMRIFVTI